MVREMDSCYKEMVREMDSCSANGELHIPFNGLSSLRCRGPLLCLLGDTKESRARYMKEAVPLYKLALSGNWKDSTIMLEKDKILLKKAITKGGATILHVATTANQVHFVEKLVNLMEEEDLELQDFNGNTAFFLAAGVGNPKLAEIMVNKNKGLPVIRGAMGLTSLQFAVIQGRREMAMYLYKKTIHAFQESDWDVLFLTSINAEMYDLAMQMIEERPKLATVRDKQFNTGLHLLARKKFTKSDMKHTQVLQLVRRLWTIILTTKESELEIREIINNPSPLVFDATLIGNFNYLAELLSIYPDLIWEKDNKGRSIIHFAIEHRHAEIFNLINEIGSMKNFIVSSADDDNNTLLHLVAKSAPPDELNSVSGAGFQLMHELLWFEEVKKIMMPFNVEAACNSEGLTPSELFTKQHKNLLRHAEKWMKGTAMSCMIVSTVIATGVFSVAFNDNTRISNDLKEPALTVFSISSAITLFSSTSSTLTFLSILFSSYAMSDFYKKLPLKLIFGLVTLFISIATMMVAFSSTLFVTYYHGKKLVIPGSISVLAFLLILILGFIQFPLWFDIIYSTYYCMSLFRPNKAYALLGK